VAFPGFNYRMDEMRAALLRVQLRRLPTFLARRRSLFSAYARRLQGTCVELPFTAGRFARGLASTAVHILPVLLPKGCDRAAVMERLKAAGIQTSIHYPPIHTFAAYRNPAHRLPRTDEIALRELTLPLYPAMRTGDVRTVASTLLEAIGYQ